MSSQKQPKQVEEFVTAIFARTAQLSAPSIGIELSAEQIARASKAQMEDFLYRLGRK